MTRVAQFRVYAEMNDFLSPHNRQRDLPYHVLARPSVKDAIEALGVPHTLFSPQKCWLGHRPND
jgi:hypothetical protein